MINPASVDISSLPQLPLSFYRNLPPVSALYFCTSNSTILYIGITKNLNARWQAHHKIYDLTQQPNVLIHWLPLEPDQLTNQLEQAFIRHWEPTLNKRLPRINFASPPSVSLSDLGILRLQQLSNEYPTKLAANIYLFLLRNLENDNSVVIHQDLLAEQMGVTTRTIRSVTKWMEDKGAFDRYKISGSVYAYCLEPLEVSNTWNDAKQYVPFNTKTLASVKSNPKLVMKQSTKTKSRKTVSQKTQIND